MLGEDEVLVKGRGEHTSHTNAAGDGGRGTREGTRGDRKIVRRLGTKFETCFS